VSELRLRPQVARPDRRGVRRERGAATFLRLLRSLRAVGRLQLPSLCTACRSHWVSLGRPGLVEFAAIPLRRSRAASSGVEVELCEWLRLEILYAFQQIWLDGGYV
jgi:hypothetical protein